MAEDGEKEVLLILKIIIKKNKDIITRILSIKLNMTLTSKKIFE